MKAHWQYLSYVIRHKWFVLLAGLGTGAPLWRLIIHDWSKFLPSEWFPYVAYFYGPRNGAETHQANGGSYNPSEGSISFNRAWLRHIHRSPHHWQHWILREDSGDTLALPMPEHFVREMVADWRGAGRAQGHGNDLVPWYERNREKQVMHPSTRTLVETLIYERSREAVPGHLGGMGRA